MNEIRFLYKFCFSSIWDMGEYCREKQKEYRIAGIQGRWQVDPSNLEPSNKKCKISENEEKYENLIEMKVAFLRANFPADTDLPKCKLHVWAQKQNLDLPTYDTRREDKLFRTILTFMGKSYTSSYWLV